jgi:hypothetical protein
MTHIINEIRKSRWLIFGLVFSIILFLLTLVLQVSTNLSMFLHYFVPPYAVPSATVITPQVKVGGDLIVSYHINRRRICRVELDIFTRNITTNTIVDRKREPGGATDRGDWPDVRNVFKLPDNIPPGFYSFQITVINECLDGLHSLITPPVRFEVIP